MFLPKHMQSTAKPKKTAEILGDGIYEIRTLKDKRTGANFFPKTHTKAVVNSNGDVLDSILGQMNDKILDLEKNQIAEGKQLPVIDNFYSQSPYYALSAARGRYLYRSLKDSEDLELVSTGKDSAILSIKDGAISKEKLGDDVQSALSEMVDEISNSSDKIVELEESLNKLNDELSEKIDNLDEELNEKLYDLDEKLDDEIEDLNDKLSESESNTNSQFDTVNERLDKLEEKADSTPSDENITIIQNNLTNALTEIENLKNELSEKDNLISDLLARVIALEERVPITAYISND